MSSELSYCNGFSMTPDQIFVTDVGPDHRDRAFYWLSIGRHVYDHRFNEITLRNLEREIDPNDVMNPVILRGFLWKTVRTKLWQVDDGHQLGPMPSQPGLDTYLSHVYYGDRRARQSVRTPLFSRTHPTTTTHQQDHNVAASPPTCLPMIYYRDRRRTKSFHDDRTPVAQPHRYHLSRRRSANDLYDVGDSDSETSENDLDQEEIPEYDSSPLMPELIFSDNAHARKYSVGLDSGVDVGYVEEVPCLMDRGGSSLLYR